MSSIVILEKIAAIALRSAIAALGLLLIFWVLLEKIGRIFRVDKFYPPARKF